MKKEEEDDGDFDEVSLGVSSYGVSGRSCARNFQGVRQQQHGVKIF